MKIPKRPPANFTTVIPTPKRYMELLRLQIHPTVNGKYLHWDKLIHLQPPNNLTSEEWWFAIKAARAALLKPIPLHDVNGHPFRFCLPDPAPEYLHHIDQDAGGRLEMYENAITNASTRDRYLIHSLVEEAITSSQLEGATTTRVVAKEMIRTGRMPRDKSEQMILNNYLAMQQIRGLKQEPLSKEMILHLHLILGENALDDNSCVGRFRQPHEKIAVYDLENQILHDPPRAEELDERIVKMCDFANGKTPDFFIHPVIRAIILHFWLAYEHPFTDGNGRCARSLFYWAMLRQGAWLYEFLSISQVIRHAPIKYGQAFLHVETDDNDLSYFIFYHLGVIRQAMNALQDYIARKVAGIKQTAQMIRASALFNHRQLALLNHALRHVDAEYSIRSHQTSHNIVYQTARTDVYDLAAKGLLEEKKRGKTLYFYPAKKLEEKLRSLQ